MSGGERTLLAWVLSTLVFPSGCMETRRSLGEDCLKDDDCLSGTCLQLRCAASPPTTDAHAMIEPAGDVSAESSTAPQDGAFDGASTDE